MTGKNLTASALVLTAALVLGIPTTLRAATLDVPGSYPTIAAAFATAQAGDRIEIAPGVYRENDLDVPNGVTVIGTGVGPSSVTLDGRGQGRIMLAEGLDLTTEISGLTFVNGRAAGHSGYDRSGGAIFISNSHLQISNCIFKYNASDGQGGAIRCNNSSPLITGCIFAFNDAGSGGGGAIDCTLYSSPLIRGSQFRGNTASWGGALSCRALSSPTVVDALFVGNEAVGAKGYGGAVFADYGSTPTFRQATYLNNTARYGGALACLSASQTNLENCTLVGNSAQRQGGGLFSYNAAPRIATSIISFQDGTGITTEGSAAPQIDCSDIFGNSQGDWTGVLAAQLSVGENLSADPLFCGGASGDGESFVLTDDSPCGSANLSCGPMGAWSVGCSDVGPTVTTFTAEWQGDDAQLSWQSRIPAGGSAPVFQLIGSRVDAPEVEWEVPIQDLGGGYYAAEDANRQDGTTSDYNYRLYLADGDGAWNLVKEITLTGVPARPGIQGLQAWPNPFNPMTTISFTLGTAQRTRISVYSPNGHRVAVLGDAVLPAGVNSLQWTGRDSEGRTVGSGTYIVLVEGGRERQTQKITLLK